MSHIFDALQRAQAENSGKTTASGATELLERAERQAVSQWNAEVKPTDPASAADQDLSFGMAAASPEPVDAPRPPEKAPAAELPKTPDMFHALQFSASPESRLVTVAASDAPAAEAFRLLGVRLRHLRRDRPVKTVLVTSTIPQEGKSFVAGNLACALAAGKGQKVLLLEGDVRRPTLGKVFGTEANPGICQWLRGERVLADSIYRMEGAGVWLLPAGGPTENPLELLQSGKLSSLMEQLNAWFDWIVIDSPPLLPLADTSVWARLADGILLVTRQGVTEKKQLQRGLEELDQKKVIGAVLNSFSSPRVQSYYYYHYSSERRPGEEVAS